MDHRAKHPFPDIAWYSGCIKCGLVVEPYHSERILRQFGYIQTIPPRPFTPPRPDSFYCIILVVRLRKPDCDLGFVLYTCIRILEF